MKYYLISEDKELRDRPQMVNWYKKIPEMYLKWGTYHKVPEKTVIFVKENKNIYFPDVVTSPFFMISKKIKDVLCLYEPNMGYRQIILIEKKNEYVFQYFIPHLRVLDSISSKSEFNLDHSIATNLILTEEKLEDRCLFELAGVKDRHVVARLDILESMLRREAIFNFTEVKLER